MTSCGGGDEAKIRELAKITCEMSTLMKEKLSEKDAEKQKAIDEKIKKIEEKGKGLETWTKEMQEKIKSDTTLANKVKSIMEEEMKKCDAAK
jgi:protoporphyrinogen oxidase